MKKVLLRFYSRGNFGDDLFIWIFSNHFKDCLIDLIVNPRYIPKNLDKNVRIHPFSYVEKLIEKFSSKVGWNSKFAQLNLKIIDYIYHKVGDSHDATVEIGGSIFMDHYAGNKEIEFQVKELPNYAINSRLQDNGNKFVIGANLGPAYSERYWVYIKEKLKEYNHVCLRDYSSYNMVKQLQHVQYAPDIAFLTPKPAVSIKEEKIVISVIDICRYTSESKVISAYYSLLSDAVTYFSEKDITVTLVSFCKREGDEDAIKKLCDLLPNNSKIVLSYYNGNYEEIIRLFAQATYIIGSRFHSIILGIAFDKPVFPIAYNSKTTHYLSDLAFSGNQVNLNDLPTLTLDDLIYNYKHKIVVDCSKHKQYAINQFWGLNKYLYE